MLLSELNAIDTHTQKKWDRERPFEVFCALAGNVDRGYREFLDDWWEVWGEQVTEKQEAEQLRSRPDRQPRPVAGMHCLVPA